MQALFNKRVYWDECTGLSVKIHTSDGQTVDTYVMSPYEWGGMDGFDTYTSTQQLPMKINNMTHAEAMVWGGDGPLPFHINSVTLMVPSPDYYDPEITQTMITFASTTDKNNYGTWYRFN